LTLSAERLLLARTYPLIPPTGVLKGHMKALICILVVCCGTAFAQEVSQISGTVTDQSGAVIPNVQLVHDEVDGVNLGVLDG
jgi:hypothetical protein